MFYFHRRFLLPLFCAHACLPSNTFSIDVVNFPLDVFYSPLRGGAEKRQEGTRAHRFASSALGVASAFARKVAPSVPVRSPRIAWPASPSRPRGGTGNHMAKPRRTHPAHGAHTSARHGRARGEISADKPNSLESKNFRAQALIGKKLKATKLRGRFLQQAEVPQSVGLLCLHIIRLCCVDSRSFSFRKWP